MKNGGNDMGQSGTRLVAGLCGLALAVGAISWWHRFETAHRATQFWGPVAAELITEPSHVLGFKLKLASEPTDGDPNGDGVALSSHEYETPIRKDLTDARGMVHLRHALMSDTNYLWNKDCLAPDDWRWMLKFSQGDRYVVVLLNEDFAILGKLTDSSSVAMVSCLPMAESLREFFQDLGLK
jgi:hypothetical protein